MVIFLHYHSWSTFHVIYLTPFHGICNKTTIWSSPSFFINYSSDFLFLFHSFIFSFNLFYLMALSTSVRKQYCHPIRINETINVELKSSLKRTTLLKNKKRSRVSTNFKYFTLFHSKSIAIWHQRLRHQETEGCRLIYHRTGNENANQSTGLFSVTILRNYWQWRVWASPK